MDAGLAPALLITVSTDPSPDLAPAVSDQKLARASWQQYLPWVTQARAASPPPESSKTRYYIAISVHHRNEHFISTCLRVSNRAV